MWLISTIITDFVKFNKKWCKLDSPASLRYNDRILMNMLKRNNMKAM